MRTHVPSFDLAPTFHRPEAAVPWTEAAVSTSSTERSSSSSITKYPSSSNTPCRRRLAGPDAGSFLVGRDRGLAIHVPLEDMERAAREAPRYLG